MSKKFNPITIKVTSEAALKRIEEDMERKSQIKEARMNKKPIEQIEKEYGVKFYRGVPDKD